MESCTIFLRSSRSIAAFDRSLQELNLDVKWHIESHSVIDKQDFYVQLSVTTGSALTMLRIKKVANVLNHKSQKLNNLLQV